MIPATNTRTLYRAQVADAVAQYTPREEALLAEFGAVMGLTFIKPNDFKYNLDGFAVTRDGIGIWVEVKTREFASDRYPTLRFDFDKIESGARKVSMFGHRFYLVVGFADAARMVHRYASADAARFTYSTVGRLNRAERETAKPMIEIPRELFKVW